MLFLPLMGLNSLISLPIDSIIAYAKSPIASHLLDKVFLERSVPPRYKKKMMMMLMKSYKELVEDRLGGRVVDTIWEQADGYMKVCTHLLNMDVSADYCYWTGKNRSLTDTFCDRIRWLTIW